MRFTVKIAGALTLALAAALWPRAALAAFEETGLGARAMGMADAVTAVSDDLSALTVNPAALGQLRNSHVSLGSHRFFNIPAGLKDADGMQAGAVVPLDAVPADGTFGTWWNYDRIKGQSIDRALALTYATRGWREIGLSTLDIGASLKDLTRTGTALRGKSAKVAGDLGAFWRLSEDKALGFSLLNVNGPRADLVGYPDRAPVTGKLGYAQSVRRFLVAMDVTKREPSALFPRGTVTGAIGSEYAFGTAAHGMFAVRTGLNLGGTGRAWSLGLGWRVLGASVDLGVRVPLSGESRFSNSVSLSYRFGAWEPEAEYERMLAGELGYRKDLSRELEASEVKQWKLAEELRLLREEMAQLRQELATRQAEGAAAQERLQNARQQLRLKELERRREEAQRNLQRLQKEREELRQKDKQGLYREDWRAYQELKRQGAADTLLVERLKGILRQYQGTGVDMGEANRELQRLLQE